MEEMMTTTTETGVTQLEAEKTSAPLVTLNLGTGIAVGGLAVYGAFEATRHAVKGVGKLFKDFHAFRKQQQNQAQTQTQTPPQQQNQAQTPPEAQQQNQAQTQPEAENK